MHIGTILHHHAARHPERPAVIFGDQTLSFHTLDTRSNQLANALIDRGLKPGDRVILYVGNSLALVEAIAAVAREHGVWLHVDGCLGGFILPFARELDDSIPPFDFSVPGVI